MKQTLSVVVSAYNAQKTLGRCLGSVSRLADEIIVVDNESQDKTVEVAKKFTKNIFSQKNVLMLNTNKNYGFTKATGYWILNLDADEEIPPELAKEIKLRLLNANMAGYWIPRKNIIFGKWISHGLWWPDRHLRLFRRGKGSFPCKHVHEYIQVDGPTDTLTTPFQHYNYESVSEFIRKMDAIYTENETAVLLGSNYQFSWLDAIRFPVSDFLKVYFAQKGYKDGLHGLVLAMLQSFYSFVVFAKLWEQKRFPQIDVAPKAVSDEFTRRRREIGYWVETTLANESSNLLTKLWHKLLRRIA